MRIDTDKIAFTTIGNGGTIADIDAVDVFQVGFVVNVTALVGAPTSFRVIAIPLSDVALGTVADHLRKTGDLTTTGVAILGNRGAAIAEPAIENVYAKIRLIADFTAGAAPTISGNLYVLKKRF